MPIHPELRASAVQWLKEGRLPPEVYSALLRHGVPPPEANACVQELVHLKQRAEASDPTRLRADASRMLFYGTSKDEVVRYFESLGIAREHAVPEVEKIAGTVHRLVACQRCGQPSAPEATFFDPTGIQICRTCQFGNQARDQQQRAVEAQQNEIAGAIALGGLGVLTLSPRIAARAFSHASAARPEAGPTTCPRCNLSSGMHRSMLAPAFQATLHPNITYACSRCGTAIA